MIYVYWYLGIGILMLPVIYVVHQLTKDKEIESILNLIEAMNPDRDKLSYRLLNKVVAPVLAVILFVAIWPVAVFIKIKEMRKKSDAENDKVGQREFAVERQHLLERLTIEEVETREIVKDPLKAAPELPFGHLNGAWKRFLGGYPKDGELWSFSAQRQNEWGLKELRSGYVIVQNGTPGAYFLTVFKEIDDHH